MAGSPPRVAVGWVGLNEHEMVLQHPNCAKHSISLEGKRKTWFVVCNNNNRIHLNMLYHVQLNFIISKAEMNLESSE